MNYKKGISACLIVKNEEHNLEKCLLSFKNFVQEIIIVDTGSTDNTIKIAEKFNCKIIYSEWKNDFSFSRNIALDNANFEFILSIDADEIIENPEKLVEQIDNSTSKIGGWLIDVVSIAARKDGGTDKFVAKLLRLFRNHPEIRFVGAIHEQVVNSVLNLGFSVENSEIIINHSGYSINEENRIKKQKRNLEILDLSLKNNPNDSHLLYHRAKTLLAINNLQDAERDIAKAISLVENDSIMAPQVLNYGAVISYRMLAYKDAIIRAAQSYKLLPNQAFANFILAEVYYETGFIDKALNHYKLMLFAIQNPSTLAKISGDYYIKPSDLMFKIGKSLFLLNKFDEAIDSFKQGLIFEPNNPYCMLGIANAEFHSGRIIEAKEYVDKLAKLYPKENRISEIYNKFYEHYKKFSNSKKSFLNGDKPLITLSMIVKNEEKYLEGCLESVYELVDEIIIVDTGSSDRTIEIAEKYGAKILHFRWIDDFSAARNEGLKHARGEWILYLDADERLIEGKENLRFFLTTLPESVGALVCSIDSLHTKNDGSSELHRGSYPRLFRNYGYPKICFLGKVHEQISQSIKALGKDMLSSDLVIEHLGYNQSIEIIRKKAQRNYDMLMQQLKQAPTDGYIWFQLGQTLGHLKLPKQAEESIKFAIQCGNLSDSIYSSAAATLSQLAGNDKRFAEALSWAEEALKISPDFLYALNLKAYSQLYLKNFTEAEATFRLAYSIYETQQGIPKSGFDIKVPLDIIEKGLLMAIEKDNKLN